MKLLVVAGFVASAGAWQVARLPARALTPSRSARVAAPVPFLAGRRAVTHALLQRALAPQMFSDPPPEEPDDKPEDVFDAMADDLTALQRRLVKIGPKSMSTVANSVTVFSALLAWFLCPPVGGVAAAGSLAAGGFGGRQLGKSLRKARRAVLPSQVAELILVRDATHRRAPPTPAHHSTRSRPRPPARPRLRAGKRASRRGAEAGGGARRALRRDARRVPGPALRRVHPVPLRDPHGGRRVGHAGACLAARRAAPRARAAVERDRGAAHGPGRRAARRHRAARAQ